MFHIHKKTGKPRSWCKKCTNEDNLARAAANPEKANARSKAWRNAHPGRASAISRAWQLRNPEKHHQGLIRSRFKIDFAELWAAQGGLCALCSGPMQRRGKQKDSAVVDHDRACCGGSTSCGTCVRGLIHWKCNLMLGYAEDQPEVLRAASVYLIRWQERQR